MAVRKPGLPGRLASPSGDQTFEVIYTLDGYASRGRLRSRDDDLLPAWVSPGCTFRLHRQQEEMLTVLVHRVRLPGVGTGNDDHFAEFIVQRVAH